MNVEDDFISMLFFRIIFPCNLNPSFFWHVAVNQKFQLDTVAGINCFNRERGFKISECSHPLNMRHKNFGTEAQLPPFHSSEAEQSNSIRQIMEHVDSWNELSQEVQTLQSIIEALKEVSEKIDKDKAGLRVVVDVMDQVHAMLSCETEGLFDLQKQVRRQVVEMCQKSVPLSLSDDVGAKLNTALNETSQKMKEIQAEYLRDIQKHNEKFLADLNNSKGVWLSRKVFWWSAGIAYVLSLLGFCIIIWNIVH